MKNIVERMINLHSTNKRNPLLIGIDGLGGAAKTSYSQELKKNLEAEGFSTVLLHMDDFIHPKRIRYHANAPEWSCYYNDQWRYQCVIDQIFTPIKMGKKINQAIELYDKEHDTYKKETIFIDNDTIVLVEGVFIQRLELRAYFDFVIYIDVSKEKRLQRVLARDTYIGNHAKILEKYEKRYFPAEEYDQEKCSPCLKADYVVKN
ncbi:uridine kinase [Pseudogracilibacillus auburnensis]|nr:uridine kinase [Pseudogracilibacillus auburnensis]